MSKKPSPKSHSSIANAKRARLSRARTAISRRNRSPLSLLRQLTHLPNLRDFHQKRILHSMLPHGVFAPFSFLNRVLSSKEDYARRVCRSRKERRQVLFATGNAGGHHRPPHWKKSSYLVRC